MKYRLIRFPGFRYKAVTLSYDDDVVYDKKLMNVLDEYGLKCTFNLNSGRFASESNGRTMTEEEAVKLFTDTPHEVAVHGMMHLSLEEFDKAVGAREVLLDRINLERMFGKIVKGMAYANGSYDDKTVEVLKTCGIDYARTVESTYSFKIPTDWLRMSATCHHDDPKLNELVDEFLEDYEENDHYFHKMAKLFYLWGHAYEFNDNDNWNVIEDFCKKVGNRKDVWYATNGEIYEYVKAFDSLVYSADGTIVYNPSAIDVYACFYGQDTLIPAGKTVVIKDVVIK